MIKYAICFGIAALMTFIVFWINGFFTDDISVNVQILSDGFCVSGILMILFSLMMYISGEGALIGISYVLRNVVLAFVPMGRKKHEFYKDYRERKLAEKKLKASDHALLFTGLLFLAVGIIFLIIWQYAL